MISRLTSDLEAINDMFTLGLDTLINAVLSVVSVGVILLVLDLPLGLVCLSGFVPLFFLDAVVPARVDRRLSQHPYRHGARDRALHRVVSAASARCTPLGASPATTRSSAISPRATGRR